MLKETLGFNFLLTFSFGFQGGSQKKFTAAASFPDACALWIVCARISNDEVLTSFHTSTQKIWQMGDENPGQSSAASSESKEKIVKVSPEDYSIDKKDYTSLKVICLGDSAVGKSK